MSIECKNCKANPDTQSVCVLHRINPKGQIGEWICDNCLETMELFEGSPHYIHSKTCPGYCDYACNGDIGFEIVEQIKMYICFPYDGSRLLTNIGK